MNSVSPQCTGPPRPAAGAVSVLVATYSIGGEGPLPESTFPPDSESWTTKNARIIALRKEKSRDAARNRRGKENYEYYELAKMLPLPAAITSQLDKASIIRLTISYLKIRDFAMQGDPPWHNYPDGHSGISRTLSSVLQGRFSQQHSGVSAIAQEVFEHNLGGHILQAFDGFLFALSNDGRFLYISETVSIYLGLSQVELTGSSVFDYIHASDRNELAEQLGMKLPPSRTVSQTSVGTGSSDGCQSSPMDSPTSPNNETLGLSMTSSESSYMRSFVIRMKSTLTKRGVHIKSSGYKVIHITGSMRPRMVLTQYSRHAPVIMGFTGVAQSLPPPTVNEIHLEPTMFVCKLDLDLTIVFCEAKIQEFIDLTAEDVTDKSLYSFLHAEDTASMRNCHCDLLSKGQMISHYFRWMCKSGGYVWVQSTATLAYARTSNDRSFMFINQVISNAEATDTIMDVSQMSSLPPDTLKGETSDGSGHESDMGNTSPDDTKGKSVKTEKTLKYSKKATQESSTSRGKSPSRMRKRKTHTDHKDTKRHRQASPIEMPDKLPVGEEPTVESKTVIVDGSAEGKSQEVKAQQMHGHARKPKKVLEDQHLRQSQEEKETVPPMKTTNSDVGCPGCEPIEDEPSPGYISPINHSVSSNGRDSDSFSNGSQSASSRVKEGWDNPPNREVPRDPEVSRGYQEVGVGSGRQVGTEDSIIIPKRSCCKGGSGCSPKPPDSMLTPPLSDSCQSQFVLPPVSSLSDTKTKHYSTDSVPAMLTSRSSSNNNHHPLPVSKGFSNQSVVSPDVELVSPQPSHGVLSKSQPITNPPTDVDSPNSASGKTEHLYNTHPRVITAVSSAYAGMPYASYGQYSNFQQYPSPVNLAAHHGYQSNPYTDHYKNFRSAHDMPMDLSYNNVGSYANMSILHGNMTTGGTTHPYYHAAKMGYATAPETSLQVIHDRGCLDEATKASNAKV
ncbi:neuronal PAS domain-containing protein 3-like isoform X2 [Acanthaster planci]|uniref:Neuronal PAS domain-containing protein 3-like isoform X2 n=1 Tax=Acanthaster planci TaxID=133434 RepID=A0A8B7YK17_ACAPL|nr:neuronal PAS domain-containing protein 3-like isoform X2 [Acanthaster planci]